MTKKKIRKWLPAMKTIRDAVHGDIRLSNDELRFVDTAPFQRLRGIKQLGTSSLVYPSAVHTRFEHSLGTAWLTKRLIESLARNGHRFDEEDAQTAVLAALLHDVTHVPFGHTFEDERRLLEKHDRDPERLRYFLEETELASILKSHPLGERVKDLLAGQANTKPLLKQLVTGTVCADLLDYLKRDAYHCGLHLAYDDRLFDYFAVVDGQLVVRLHKQGAIRQDVLTELIHLLQLRYTLTERVYYHHAKIVSGAMVSRALELALAAEEITPPELYELRDDSLLYLLTQMGESVEGLEDLMNDWSSRRLYRRAYYLTAEGPGRPGLDAAAQDKLAASYHHDQANRQRAEEELAGRLGVPKSHVIIYCPSPRMQLKEADVPVEIAAGVVEPLSQVRHPDVEALAAKHKGLWRFYVLVRRADDTLAPRAGEECAAFFGHSNQMDPSPTGRVDMSAG